MEFIKKNWFYLLAALVLVVVFYQINSIPSGVISTAPPPAKDMSFKTYNNVIVPANEIDVVKKPMPAQSPATETAAKTTLETAAVEVNGDTIAVTSVAGKPLEIIIKDKRSHHGSDEENDLNTDPRTLKAFSMV